MLPKQAGEAGATSYQKLSRVPGSFHRIDSTRLARSDQLTSQGGSSTDVPLTIMGKTFTPRSGMHWKTTTTGLRRLGLAGRLGFQGQTPAYLRFFDDFPVFQISNQWNDTGIAGYAANKVYVVQTLTKVIERCIQMTTDPGDLVFDPTCGSGTTAIVAEQWGRRWITCDTSRVALSLAKQRLMTAHFSYYELAHPEEGVGSGFKYKTVPHIMLRDIANNPEIDSIWQRHQQALEQHREQLNATLGESWEDWEMPRDADDRWPEEGRMALTAWWERRLVQQKEIDEAIARNAGQETLYDQPLVDNSRKRVTGPFSVEAVPAPTVKPIDNAADTEALPADISVARSGETLRQSEWRDELLKTGIRGKAGQFIRFARLEPLPGCRWLNADGESLPNDDGVNRIREGVAQASQRIVVSFGPEHAPLEQRQVNQALQEAETLRPQPKVLVFAAFQFDPEAAKDIDETNWPGVSLLKAQMNADLLTEDLKRKRASNESFWLIGQPDVRVEPLGGVNEGAKYQVSVQGFDYYNTKTGDVESGRQDKIAMWMLDIDYDGRSLYPRQVFFPMAGPGDGWARLARNLKAEIDEELIEAYRGGTSLPFEAGEHRRIAVKIVDDRGIESLKVIALDTDSARIAPVEQRGETLDQILDDVAKRIPQEVKDQFPSDFIENMDHYLYGADKQ